MSAASGPVQEVLEEIAAIHERKPYFRHPVWAELVAGALSREQVRVLIRQNGIIPLHNHNYHGRLYVACPDPAWRVMIAEVVYEEGTGRLYAGGRAHWKLYCQLGEALGIRAEDMWRTEYCAGALAFKAFMSEICGRSFLEGVSAHMLAGEAPVPVEGMSRAEALRKHYGLDDKALEFFAVHQEADDDHSSVGVNLLAEFAPTEADRRLVVRTVEDTLDMFLFMYDDIHEQVKKAA